MIDRQAIKRFFESSEFFKGFILTFAIVLPVYLGFYMDQSQLGLTIALGVIFSSSPDVQGTIRHKMYGIGFAIVLSVVVTILMTIASNYSPWLLVPVLGILVFFISYISVFGFRASLVSFSGLSAVVLSFAHPVSGMEILHHAGLIGLGGIWYLVLSFVFNIFIHKKTTELLLADCIELTADYLATRGEFAVEKADKDTLQKKMFTLQTDINEKLETLREILMSDRQKSGHSNYQRKQLLIFIELVDMLELAIANTDNLYKIDEIFHGHEEKIEPYKKINSEMADRMKKISEAIRNNKPLKFKNHLETLLKRAQENIEVYVKEVGLPKARKGSLILRNLYDYEEKQVQKVTIIERILNNLNEGLQSENKERARFITHQDYDFKTFRENFSIKSPSYKHSLRLTLTIILGFLIGKALDLENFYWILLTIVVIMRPSYGLTKERTKHRIAGTFIGAAIAVSIIFLTQNTMVYSILAIASLLLSFSFLQKNYKAAAMFITLSIIFLYSILVENALELVKYRVIDTFIGATLSYFANLLFWPSWQFLNIRKDMVEAIEANSLYLIEIDRYYHNKETLETSYKLSRKQAFLAIGNLNAAFQRMTQEPKSKQKELSYVYEIVTLNNTFLSAAASLGTFMRAHKTTKASRHFEVFISGTNDNLINAMEMLNYEEITETNRKEELVKAEEYLENKFKELVKIRDKEIEDGIHSISHEMRLNLQEARMITDQLRLLLSLSSSLKNAVTSYIKIHGKRFPSPEISNDGKA